MNLIDLTNQTFGKLKVVSRADNRVEPSGRSKVYWLCKCECGNEKEIESSSLRAGTSKSCGCVGRGKIKNLNLSHNKYKTPEYRAYQKMKERCLNKNVDRYKNYGGRGITICDSWLESFQNFYEDMGERPSPEHSLDRKNVNGNYEKENCRWATKNQQDNNKVNTIYVQHNNETKSLSDWCRYYGLNYKSTWKKYKLNNSFEDIIKNVNYGRRINIK